MWTPQHKQRSTGSLNRSCAVTGLVNAIKNAPVNYGAGTRARRVLRFDMLVLAALDVRCKPSNDASSF